MTRPLGPFAAQAVAVYPAQRFATVDSTGWTSRIADGRAALAALDDELAFAFRDRRGLGAWRFARDVVRLASAGGGPYATVVTDLPVEPLTGPVTEQMRRIPPTLGAPLRTVGAVTDTRYALLPVQVRFERVGDGIGRAVLRAAFVDVRSGQAAWIGDVAGDPSPAWTPAVFASLAQRFADLVLAP
jgi:hypothetical protein